MTNKEELLQKIPELLNEVKSKNPLTHCITNFVTVNDCANAVLAIGASPIMSEDIEEVVEVVVHQGKATFEFSTKNYDSSNNIIEGFSVFDPNRPKSVIYNYNVPESEIPK